MIASKTEEIRDIKAVNNNILKWALGILGTLAAAGIIGNVSMYGQMSRNTQCIEDVKDRLERIENTQHEILRELRK